MDVLTVSRAVRVQAPAPRSVTLILGQHSRQTLEELLGLSPEALDSLVAGGVLYDAADRPA